MDIKQGFSIISKLCLLTIIIITLTTCSKKGEDPPPPEAAQCIISPKAKFIVDTDWQSKITSIDSSNYTMIVDQDLISKYSLVPGDLIVSSVGNGILRKIETITSSGNNLQIQTSQATLVDLIQQGDIDFKTSLTVSKIKSINYYYPGVQLDTISIKSTDGTLFNWDINTEIYPQIRLQGNFQLTNDFIVQIQISILEGLKKVKFGFEGNEEFNLALIAGKQFTIDKEITLATVYFSPIFIPIPVPPFTIPIVPVLDIKLGLNGYANANISTSLSQNFSIETGLQYIKQEGWSSYMNYDKSFNYTSPQLNLNAGAEAFIKPELRMLIFNILGPYINAKGYGKIEADLTQNPWWKMYYGITMAAGVKATILDLVTLDFSVDDLLNWEQQVGQAPNGTLPTVITESVTSISENKATTGGNVTSEGGLSVTARGVCWSTSQNPTTNDAHTSDGNGIGSFISILTGLTPSSPYYVRAYSTNIAGTAYGNEVSFTTMSTWSCGSSIIINHVAGAVAPVNKTVTYGSVTNIPGETSKCWITSNLGADHQATAKDDATEASAGWYWQFNRKQGYKHDGTTRTPNTTWIDLIDENSDWATENDPCSIELGSGWRIPTTTEWTNVDGTGGWANWNDLWNSALKMHAAGYIYYNSEGKLHGRGEYGDYSSGTQSNSINGWNLNFTSSYSRSNPSNKAYGQSIRCLRD